MGGTLDSFLDEPIQDAPWDLVEAISGALQVLSWYEHLNKDEVPPRWIWWSGDLLDEWFEDVRKRRESKNKKGSSYERGTEVPMMGNKLLESSNQDGRSVPI